MRLLTALLLVLLLSVAAFARRQQTTIRGSRANTAATSSAIDKSLPEDTITDGLRSLFSIAGYDKPLNASRETLHLTNLSSSDTITSVTLDITYLDSTNRQLHRREVTINVYLTPGETLLVSFPTWDIQHSFYYLLSAKPRRQATPYTITAVPLSATVIKSRL